MKTGIRTRVHTSTRSILRLGMLGYLGALLPAGGQASASQRPEPNSVPAKAVQTVRAATQQFIDVNAATPAGHKPFLGCITGPGMAAMGVHYGNADLVNGGQIHPTQPQAPMHEPTAATLTAAVSLADSATWSIYPWPLPPVPALGHVMRKVGSHHAGKIRHLGKLTQRKEGRKLRGR